MDKFRRFIKDNKDVLLCFLGAKVLFAVMLLITKTSYSEVLGFFDAEHYRRIAADGYYIDGETVFFPVIPLIIRYLGDIGLVVINQIAFITALYLLKKILLRLKGGAKVSTVLAVVAVSPLALFTSLEYTEALFFLFTVAAFLLFVEKKYPLLMGLILGLSVATRNTGSLLFFAIFTGMCIRLVQSKEKGRCIKDILMCYIPATAISLIYPVFLQLKFGNWKIFMDAQYSYWIRIPSNIIKTTWISLKVIFTDTYQFDGAVDTIVLFKINEVLSVLLMAFVIFLIVREILLMRRRKTLSAPSVAAIVYSVLFIIAICMTIRDPKLDCPTDSFYRYYMSLFPMYLGLGRFSEKGADVCLIVSLVISLVTSSMFCLGAFFF